MNLGCLSEWHPHIHALMAPSPTPSALGVGVGDGGLSQRRWLLKGSLHRYVAIAITISHPCCVRHWGPEMGAQSGMPFRTACVFWAQNAILGEGDWPLDFTVYPSVVAFLLQLVAFFSTCKRRASVYYTAWLTYHQISEENHIPNSMILISGPGYVRKLRPRHWIVFAQQIVPYYIVSWLAESLLFPSCTTVQMLSSLDDQTTSTA